MLHYIIVTFYGFPFVVRMRILTVIIINVYAPSFAGEFVFFILQQQAPEAPFHNNKNMKIFTSFPKREDIIRSYYIYTTNY